MTTAPPFVASPIARLLRRMQLLGCVLALGACAAPPTDTSGAADVIENSLGMAFVRVTAGEFFMGSDETPARLQADFPRVEPKRLADLDDEAPRHRVRIGRPFYMGRHEVTVGRFRAFLAASGHVPESEADSTGGYGFNPTYDPAKSRRGDAFEGRDPKYSWRNPGFAQDDSHPVVNVTWNDAVALAKWLSKKEGVVYRLPNEAEWEYACRAGTTTRYPGSDDPRSLPGIGNTFDRTTTAHWPVWRDQATEGNDGYAFTAPVGSFAPNAFGLHDMVGNAWEWTGDWYDEAYDSYSSEVDPPGPANGNVKVRRGGSWHTWPLYARCSYRNWNTTDTHYVLVGIRLLREIGPAR